MKTARVVIGANFGDEGKGLVTDFLSSQTGPETLVVRFNGGAQAGHTVTLADGRRHVFGHFGSGSLNGCPSYLSRFFVCNPLVFLREHADLRRFGVTPVVYIDGMAPVTTPYDMMINQCIEEMRGAKRHGSCGLGFGETLERHQHPGLALKFADLYAPSVARATLEAIRDFWVPERLRALGVEEAPDEWKATFLSAHVVNRFLGDIETFLQHVRLAPPDLLHSRENIVFEGAHGLLLDQGYGWFPHVTRSNTGLKNVVALAEEAGIASLSVHYLTRSYLTRHGAGPMPNETPGPVYAKIHDPTNIANRFQGSLRFGYLDIDQLGRAIAHDKRYCPSSIRLETTLFVGCMDQIDDCAKYMMNGTLRITSKETFLRDALRRSGAQQLLASSSPTREGVSAPKACAYAD